MNHIKTGPTDSERYLYMKYFQEAAFMGGVHVRYYQIVSRDLTDVSSEYYSWNDPVDIDVIYDERPKPSLLRELDWFTEDTDIQPRLLYVPTRVGDEDFVVSRGDLVEIPSGVNSSQPSIFQVSIVRTDLVHVHYICNIVPYREQLPQNGESTNYRWLEL